MSDSSVQIATVVISVVALVFSTTAAFWALVYNRRQARAVAQANALSALETDSVDWSTHQIANHLKRSADAQEEQSRSVEALSSEVRKRLGQQRPERQDR